MPSNEESTKKTEETTSSYRCIRFNLYGIHQDTTIGELVSEIKMCFHHRGECHIHSEEYKRSANNMFVVVEVRGAEQAIEQAITEAQYAFNRKCEKSDNEHWFA